MVYVQENLQCAELLRLVPSKFLFSICFSYLTLVNVLVGHVLFYWHEMQFRACELSMTAFTNLTFEQLVLIRDMRALVSE